ncbi:MAG: transposase [Puniceicoccales bacterium]|nr:transposase [Puniceicoccales bacterium]
MPQYTGQKCSHCGYIAEENRESQAKFKCYNSRFEVHALTTIIGYAIEVCGEISASRLCEAETSLAQ